MLPSKDLTEYKPYWRNKKQQLIWRGSTAQGGLMQADNLHQFSRVLLCELSQQYPTLIDARFTLFVQGGENIPYLRQFESNKMSFEEQTQYKYHLFIDGNVSPYSASCWKLFINSLVFKPDSPWYQWYFKVFHPYEHYIPVKQGLSDLVEKIEWAKNNDYLAAEIANQCRNFALEHLTVSDCWLYFYTLLEEYSRLLIFDSPLLDPD